MTVQPEPASEPATPAAVATTPTPPAQASKSCRLPEHGIEAWRSTEKWTADSDWRKGGSSPAEFCGAQKLAREAKFPDREVMLLGMDEKQKTEYTPFKHDYYRYTCLFEDQLGAHLP